MIEEAKDLRAQTSVKERELEQAVRARQSLLHRVPNLTHPDTPVGKTDEDNRVLRQVGAPPAFDFEPRDHLSLMEAHDMVDFAGGARVAGQKFLLLEKRSRLAGVGLGSTWIENLE